MFDDGDEKDDDENDDENDDDDEQHHECAHIKFYIKKKMCNFKFQSNIMTDDKYYHKTVLSVP